MKKIIHARIYQGDKYYVAECLDFPVVTQGKTLDEVSENLQEAITLHLEGEDLAELDMDSNPAILASLELALINNATSRLS